MQSKPATRAPIRSSFASTAGGFVTSPVRAPDAPAAPCGQAALKRR